MSALSGSPRALPFGADLSWLAMFAASASVERSKEGAKARRERRRRHVARLRLTLVRDGAAVAGHRGGPCTAVPQEADLITALRLELQELRSELAALKAAVLPSQVKDAQVPETVVEEKTADAGGHSPHQHVQEAEGDVQVAEAGGDFPQCIQLKLIDVQGETHLYWLENTVPLRNLVKMHCSKRRLQESRLRFLVVMDEDEVDGWPIREDQTAREQGLVDGDCIRVVLIEGG